MRWLFKNLRKRLFNKNIKDHESFVRKIFNTTHNIPYKAIKNLEEAKKMKNSFVIFEGDCGGTIYLTCPANMVKCEEKNLQELLEFIDNLYWKDLSMASIYYEQADKIPSSVAGGMGGGVLNTDIWIHPEIEKLNINEKIKNIIYKI